MERHCTLATTKKVDTELMGQSEVIKERKEGTRECSIFSNVGALTWTTPSKPPRTHGAFEGTVTIARADRVTKVGGG